MITEQNAVISRVRLTNDDHGLLSAWLDLEYDGSGQGFGGYCLYSPHFASKQGNYAGHFIWRVLEVAGVSEWGALPGRTIRVRQEHTKVHAIGHIVKNIWFDPSAELKALEAPVLENANG